MNRSRRESSVAAVVAITIVFALALGCSKKEATMGSGAASGMAGMSGGTRAPHPLPGDVNCYKTTNAKACPPPKDGPPGATLPKGGGVCSLPSCTPCGSATAPAFVDGDGNPKPGWCICVPRSDDSGVGVYSCFGLDTWHQPN